MRHVNPYDRFKLRVFDAEKKKYLNNDDVGSKTDSCCTSVYELMELFLSGPDKLSDHLIFEQCTGLKDKNNKLIFENDIVRLDNWNYCVSFDETHPGFLLESPEEFFEEISIENADKCEIIGNLQENPELIDNNSKEGQ